MTWLRISLASVILAGGAMAGLAAGCGGDDTSPGTSADSGVHDTSTGDTGPAVDSGPVVDSGHKDGGDGGVAEGGVKDGKVVVVHASPDLFLAQGGGIRFCFATAKGDASSSVGPLAALPDDDTKLPAGQPFPGMFPGTGGALPDLLDLAQYKVTAYALSAAKLKQLNEVKSNPNEDTCDVLIGATGAGGKLTLGTDYYNIGTIPAGTLAHGTTTLGAITGCVPGETDATTIIKCGGTSYSATTGNLGITAIALDRTTVVDAGGGMGWTFANLSMPWDGIVTATATAETATYAGTVGIFVNPVGGDAGPDGGPSPVPISAPTTPLKFGAKSATATSNVVAPTTVFVATAIGADGGAILSAGGQPFQVPMPLAAIQALSYGPSSLSDAGAQTIFQNGGNYTFVLVGDPAQAQTTDAGTFNLYSPHFLAFPNDPPLPAP